MFETRKLRLFEPKKNEVAEGRRNSYTEELSDFYKSPDNAMTV
jgi:hypothetical protein